jgi:hypothetical protein
LCTFVLSLLFLLMSMALPYARVFTEPCPIMVILWHLCLCSSRRVNVSECGTRRWICLSQSRSFLKRLPSRHVQWAWCDGVQQLQCRLHLPLGWSHERPVSLCAAGSFSTSGSSACGMCDAGYACPAGSTASNPASAMCPAGTFSIAGALSCTNCSAGYACPPGSTSSTPATAMCVAGRFSVPGATSCANCSAGYACPAASTSSTPATAMCPAGTFSRSGDPVCSNCSAGYACPTALTRAELAHTRGCQLVARRACRTRPCGTARCAVAVDRRGAAGRLAHA